MSKDTSLKLLFFTDSHLRGTTPIRRKDKDYVSTLKNKVKEIGEIAKKENVDYILQGGDLFDRPDTSPSIVNNFIKLFKEYPVPIYAVAGNHEVFGYNPDTINRTMLGLLINAGIFNFIKDEDEIFIEKNDINLQLTGRNFRHGLDKEGNTTYNIKKDEKADYAVHMVHGMLLNTPFFEGVEHTLISDVKTEADVVLAGHYHPGFKKTIVKNGTNFVNPGSMVRTNASSGEMKRKPKVAIIEFSNEDFKITYKHLKSAKKATEVLDRESILLEEQKENNLFEFVRELKSLDSFETYNIDDILKKISENKKYDEKLLTKALKRLEKIQERNDLDAIY